MDEVAGDDVLSQRLEDALPPTLRMQAVGITGGYDTKVAALDRMQAVQAAEPRPRGTICMRRWPEQVSEVEEVVESNGGCVDEFLQAMVEEYLRRGGRGAGGGESGLRDARNVPRNLVEEQIQNLPLDTSQPPGTKFNPVGPDPAKPQERQFYSNTRRCFGCERFGHTRTAPDNSVICKWPRMVEGNDRGRVAGRGGSARN